MLGIPPIVRPVETIQLDAGQAKKARLSLIPAHLQGLPLHYDAITLTVTVTYDADGNGAAGDQPGDQVASCIRNVELWSGSHFFVKNLDGEEINHLAARRYGSRDPIVDPADLGNGTAATDATVTFSVRIQCAEKPLAADSEPDGCIPVALLDESRGDCGLSFELADAIPVGPGGYTVKSASVEVTAELRPLSHLRAGLTPWRMRAYTEVQKDFTVHIDGRALYCAIRDRAQEDGTSDTTPDHSGYDQLTLHIGDQVIYSNRTAAEVAGAWSYRRPLGTDGLTVDSPEELPIAVAYPGQLRTRMATGPLRLEVGTREDSQGNARTSHRVLIHETGLSTTPKLHEFAQRVGAPPVAGDPSRAHAMVPPRFASKDGRSASHPVAAYLDRAVYWPGMAREGYRVPQLKLSKPAGKGGA